MAKILLADIKIPTLRQKIRTNLTPKTQIHKSNQITFLHIGIRHWN